jgi:rhodanese-related sulfurtransferase
MDGEIGVEELESLLDNDEARVVDIRSPAAFKRGHIPGSENVPFPSLIDEVEQFEGEDRVVTVCPKGESSVQAARLIASYGGFDGRVDSFGPGLRAWDGPLADGHDDENESSDDEGPDAPF